MPVILGNPRNVIKEKLMQMPKEITAHLQAAQEEKKQLALKEQLRQQEFQDKIALAREQAKIQQEYGGLVNIVDPVTGEVKSIYTPGGGKAKTYLGQKERTIPKITPQDIESIGGIIQSELEPERLRIEEKVSAETPYLKGFPGVLERFMPFGGVARKRGIKREAERQLQGQIQKRMQPIYEQQEKQFLPSVTPATQSIFTGQPMGQPNEAQINALKPPQVEQEDWDTATLEQKIEFLRNEGLL